MPDPSVPDCAWCDKPATRLVTVEPPRSTVINTPAGRKPTKGMKRQEPACEDHAHPEKRTDPPRPKRGEQTPGQLDIFDVLDNVA